MKVSVLVPTYNRAAFIVEALSGVLAQTIQDFEIIVVDDGSTDDTAERVRGLGDARIHYLTQEHRGVSAALNLGWQHAHGEYIARLDSDDRWLATLLQELTAPLDADSTLGVVYGRAQGINALGERLPQLTGAAERFAGQTLKSLIYGDFVCPTAVVIRRAALAQVGGYDESLIANEDWDLWIRIAPHYGIAYIPRVLAEYRYHAQNLTRTTSERMERLMQDRVRVLDKFFAHADTPPDILAIKPIAYRNVYLDWTIRRLEAGQWKLARASFVRALELSPSRLQFLPRAAAIAAYYLFLSKTNWGVTLFQRAGSLSRKASRPPVKN